MLEVAVLDLLHEGFALENIALETGGELVGDDEKLVVGDFGKRDGAARGNEMRSPLKDEAGVPESGDGEKRDRGGESGAAGAEELHGAIEKNGEAENKKRCERNEKAIAVGRDASPIGVAGDEIIKSEKGGKQQSAHTRFAPPEEEKSREGEKKNGSPGKKTVIGGEEHTEKDGRGPEPVVERNISGFERASVNQIARDESREKTDEESCGKQKVAEEKLGDARGGKKRRTHLSDKVGIRDRCSFGGLRAERGEILAEGFDCENGEDHGVGVIDVEHEAGD